ncbi:MAG: hypothetical protein A2033_01220 [Bacteroidetes bacterium GWA2_31_9]|nr:MAG: hypothetical protein A2033_01220 [Bacteroidetes bacterium GWA2_31_9]
MIEQKNKIAIHRFLDEAGDTAFFGKGKSDIIGTNGVSNCFMIGMVKFKEPIEQIRLKVKELQNLIVKDPYFNVPSINKKEQNSGYYFHATDDLPEVRKLFFDFIKQTDCSFEAVVATKTIGSFVSKYKSKEEYFYADILSHLLKNKLTQKKEKIVLHISARGKSTKNNNLELAFAKAKQRFLSKKSEKEIKTIVVFNVTYPSIEPLLSIADYFCWAVQRVFERGETRFYDSLKEKISTVIDLHDISNYKDFKNYYGPKNPLTSGNKKSPQLH